MRAVCLIRVFSIVHVKYLQMNMAKKYLAEFFDIICVFIGGVVVGLRSKVNLRRMSKILANIFHQYIRIRRQIIYTEDC